MVHLEQRNKMTKTFRNNFRDPKKPQWTIDRSKPYEISQEVYDYYANGPGFEDHNAMTEYNAKENYGSAAAAGISEPTEKVNAAGLTYNPMLD